MTKGSVDSIGVICGGTDLAEVTIKSIISKGIKPVIVAIENEADESLATAFENVHWLQVGSIGKAIEIFKSKDVDKCLMIGRVDHRRIFENINFDKEMYKVYVELKDRRANTLLEALINVFRENGLHFIDTTEFLKDFLAPEGIIGSISPDDKIQADIAFGWEIAKKIGELDIGQSVLVKDKAVVAVEAMEGTDELIERSRSLCPGGAILVKVAKPKQDNRFDMPVVGSGTMKKLASVKAKALAVEAGKTIVINIDEMKKIADESGILFLGIRDRV